MIKYKSIIVGCGKIAGLCDDNTAYVYSHAKAYSLNANIDLVCCCDLNIDKAKRLAEKYNVDLVNNDYLDVIEQQKPDIISVCTPDDSHFEIVMSILNSSTLPKILFTSAILNGRGSPLFSAPRNPITPFTLLIT